MNVAVIGAGRWGKNILTTLASSPCTIPYIAYGGSSETKAFLRLNYPKSNPIIDYREALAESEVDAVCIATPILTHANIVRDALTAGKHVFVEKPLSSSLEEIRELYTLAEEKNKTLFTGYIYLFDPEFQSLQKKLEGEKKMHIEMNWEKQGSFESPLIVNLLVHELAILHELIGDVTLDSIIKNRPDIFDATFKSAYGTSHIHIDRTKTEKLKRLTVQTSNENYEHIFNNKNLLSLELNAFFEATKTGNATNKKRQCIDESIAAVLADLPSIS